MSSSQTTEANNLPQMAQISANVRPSLNADAEAFRRQGRTSPRSAAYAVLYQLLQNNAEQVEARCKRSEAWWMQGAVRWKARLREDFPARRSHGGDGKEEDTGRDRQRRHFEDEFHPPCNVMSLVCMNEFVLLRRVYGRGHLAKVTSALALTSSLLPVALKTYVVSALKRTRTAVFGAEGMHMTNEYQKVRREIALQSSLHHPNVCPLYGVINDVETGCLHLVLQLLPYPLMEWVEESRAYTARPADPRHRRAKRFSVAGSSSVLVYTEDAVRRILSQVLDALDYVHSQSIVHKDVKPENILSATPPSSSELILVHLACAQAWPASDEGVSSPESSLRGIRLGHRDAPPPRTTCEPDEEVLARLTNTVKDETEDESRQVNDLMGQRTDGLAKPVGMSDGTDVDVCYARSRLGDSAVEHLCDEMREKAQGWSDQSSYSEETNFSESDSDEEHGVCDCDLHCTCPLVAQVPDTPAFQTSLAVVQKRLSPYAAYARQARQATERSTTCNSVVSSESRSHVRTGHYRARKKPLSADAANGTQLTRSAESSGSPNRLRHTSSQHIASGADSRALAPEMSRQEETTNIEMARHDDGAQSTPTLPESLPSNGKTGLECTSRIANARGTGECRSPVENSINSGVAPVQVVSGAAGSSGESAGDFLVILARRITARFKRAGLLRPLFQVIFEGEANIFPVFEKRERAGDQLGLRGGGECCWFRKRMFLEDVHLASNACELDNSHTSATDLLDQEKCHQTLERDAEGGSSKGQICEERATHGRKRSRERSRSASASQEVRSCVASGVSPGSEQVEGLTHFSSSVTCPPNPSVVLVTDAKATGPPASIVNWKKVTGNFFDVNGSACWKLIDFSSACVTDDERLTIWDSEGTRHFTPPECLGVSSEEGWAGRPRDLWSVGVLLYCLFYGTLPFRNLWMICVTGRGSTGLELSIAIMNDALTFPDHRKLSDSAKNLLSGLLRKDPNERLTSKQIRSHPWLSGVASEACERLK